jgi:hypothetical protein
VKLDYDHGYRLRIEHPDRAEVRLLWAGPPIVFDPADPPAEGEIIVLTGPAPDRLRATAAVVKAGKRPIVVASDELCDWLTRLGPIDGGPGPREVAGVKFDSMRYDPPSGARPFPQRIAAYVGALRPGAALRHLRERSETPDGQPHIWQVTFPDGGRFLHLDLALHSGQNGDWVDRAAGAFGNPDWLLLGAAHGEGEGVRRWISRFGGRVLLTDLVNGERRAMGLPVELVTPLRDQLMAAGVDTHVFATQASYRFE